MLSLPYVLVLSGYVLGLVFMLTGAIAAVWSNKIIARTAIEAKLPNLSVMAEKAGGKALARSL